MSIARMKVTIEHLPYLYYRVGWKPVGEIRGRSTDLLICLYILCPPLRCYPNKKHNNKSNALF